MTTGRFGLRHDTFFLLLGAGSDGPAVWGSAAAEAPPAPGLPDLMLILSALSVEAESDTSSPTSIAVPKNASHLRSCAREEDEETEMKKHTWYI